MAFVLDIKPLKEPLGFIRVLEWVFAIFAFASTCNYSSSTHLIVQCQGSTSIPEINISFQYPFRLNKEAFDAPTCDNKTTTMKKYHLTGDQSSPAEFFVAVGVLAFLYCTSMLALYVGYQHLYRESNRGPVIDLIITMIFAFLWLVASSAWAKGLNDVKLATSPTNIISVITACGTLSNKCTAGALPTFGPLHSSVISGFLNLLLWAGNCWFIFKETHFHTKATPSTAQQEATRQP